MKYKLWKACGSAFQSVYIEDELFKQHFSKKEFITTNTRNKKIVRYILLEIERQRSGKDFSLENQTYNLEHILPEHPSESWAYIDESKQEQLIYRLGNMTLLEANWNRDLGNSDYAEKKRVYQQSAIQITQDIQAQHSAWNEEAVESRQRSLANTAVGIWRMEL